LRPSEQLGERDVARETEGSGKNEHFTGGCAWRRQERVRGN